MSDKSDDVCLLTDGEGDGSVSPTPATVPKKRGRPSKPNKAKMMPSGRGRGRPKGDVATPFKKSGKNAAAADGSADEEGTASDGGSPLPNGDEEVVSSGRGRPSKGKRKAIHVIEPTGKGRGRPKKSQKTDAVDDEEGNDDNEDAESGEYKPTKKTNLKKSGKKGRPSKKSENSDDDSSDDKLDEDEERHSAGRPASGGVNLNISRTGRGQGRPKFAAKRGDAKNGSDSPKKRGRPTSGPLKGPYIPTGKPRGRPKHASGQESQDDDVEENPSKDAENSEDDGDYKANSDSADE